MADTPLDTLDRWRAQQTNGRTEGARMPRLTVRLPLDLYARLEAFAAQYRSHRGDPPLAGCVREMVTFCLDHPDLFRQSLPVPSPVPQGHRRYYRQPETSPTFDTQRFFVGALCPQRHQYQDSGGSLRYGSGEQVCVTCRRERNARYNARKRERQAWKQTTPQHS